MYESLLANVLSWVAVAALAVTAVLLVTSRRDPMGITQPGAQRLLARTATGRSSQPETSES